MDVGRGSSRGPVSQRSRAAAATAGTFWWEPCPEGLIFSISAALFGVEGEGRRTFQSLLASLHCRVKEEPAEHQGRREQPQLHVYGA